MKCISVKLLAFAVLLQVTCQAESKDAELGSVGNVTISSVGTDSVTVNWETPETVGDGYYFQLFAPNGTLLQNDSVDGKNLQNHTITGLVPGTGYNVSVAACRACTSPGELGPESFAEDLTRTKLSAPSKFAVSGVNTTSISMGWTHATGSKDSYRINCTAVGDAGHPATIQVDGETGTCSSLTQGTLYEVTIETVKNGFQMEDCGESCSQTNVTEPEPVQKLTLESDSPTQILVEWEFGDRGNYGYFELSYTPGDGVERLTQQAGTIIIDELQGNQHYTFTMVTYSNYSSDNMASSEPKSESIVTDPEPVDSVTVSAVSPSSVEVSWVPPNNTENVTHYVFTLHDKNLTTCVGTVIMGDDLEEGRLLPPCDNDTMLKCSEETPTSCTLDGLDACTLYSVNISVYTSNQTSSAKSDEDNTGVSDVSKQIQNFEMLPDSATNDSVKLKWDKVAGPGKCLVLFYRVSYTYKNCTDDSEQSGPDSEDIIGHEYEITNLPYDYWDYNTTIQAFTRDNGDGTASEQSTIAKTAESAPGPPASFTANNTGFNVTLEWEPPEKCEQNGEITQYQVEYSCVEPDRPTITVVNDNKVFGASETSATLRIGPYRFCTFSLKANTSELGEAITDTAVTPESIPGRVRNITVASSNGSSIDLEWVEPEYRNGPIIQYTVKWENNGPIKESSTSRIRNVTGSSIISLHLVPYSKYSITVTAWTSIGEGLPKTEQVETEETKPGAVRDIQVERSYDSFNVSWTPSHKTGETNFSISVCEEEVAGCEHTPECKEIIVEGYDTNSAHVPGLVPNWPYTVDVTAVTSIGPSSTKREETSTSPTNPPKVEDFVVSLIDDDCSRITASWEALLCEDRNANITHYVIEADSGSETITKKVPLEDGNLIYTVSADAKADTEFTVRIYAVADGFVGEKDTEQKINTSTCAPGYPDGDNDTFTQAVVPDNSVKTDNPQRQFVIQLSNSFLTDDTQGEIKHKGYIVAQDEKLNMTQERLSYDQFKDTYDLIWKEVQDSAVTPPYRATPDGWEPPEQKSRKRATDDVRYDLIGAEKDCDGITDYCNGYLKAGRSYRVKVFACTETDCSLTTYSAPFATEGDVDDDGGGTPTAVAVAVPLVLIIVIAAAVAGFIYKKKYYNRTTRKQSEPTSNGLHIVKPNVNEGFEMDEPPKPIPKDEFEERVQELRKDSDLLFSEEYKLLKDISPRMDWEIAELPHNRVKNRYTNILAYDHSRVKLVPTEDDDDDGSDYINANYMPGFNSKREFIAAQGPLPSTKDDFWRMVWEQNVPIIVMLTKCVERGRQKCDQYWPSDTEPVFYGDLQIQIKSESVLDHYTIRIIDIKLGEKSKVIKQFHFTTWPDMGSPDTTDALLSFVKAVRSHKQPDMVGPMMVHCSAGVGRTGTFICVDTLLHHIVDDDSIDIFGMVLDLRKYRTNIVQTEDQYIYIHECMKDALRRGIMLKPSLYQHDDSPVYANVDTSDIQLEDNLYENVEIRSPVHIAHVVESDPEEDQEEAPLTHDQDLYEEDRV